MKSTPVSTSASTKNPLTTSWPAYLANVATSSTTGYMMNGVKGAATAFVATVSDESMISLGFTKKHRCIKASNATHKDLYYAHSTMKCNLL